MGTWGGCKTLAVLGRVRAGGCDVYAYPGIPPHPVERMCSGEQKGGAGPASTNLGITFLVILTDLGIIIFGRIADLGIIFLVELGDSGIIFLVVSGGLVQYM